MAATAAAQSGSRHSTAADALAALVDAAAAAPQMDVSKSKESKHERDDEMSSMAALRRAPSVPEQQQQQEAERRSMQSAYGAMSLPGGKPHAYSEGPGMTTKDKGPQTSKARIEEELRTRGKTTITAASFIDVIITRQIASDKDSRERGSQSSDSSSSCKHVRDTRRPQKEGNFKTFPFSVVVMLCSLLYLTNKMFIRPCSVF